jgi:hypothetical protein
MTDGVSGATAKSAMLQAARKLERLAKKVESSLVEQFRQLDDLLAQEPRPANLDNSRESERIEFVQRQAAWERQKDEEFQRIEQERTQLGEAWAHLETEQRRVLAEDALRRAQATATRDSAVGRAHELTDEPPDATSRSAGNGAAGRRGSTPTREIVSRESVLVEYEQLKSDVQKHARRLRRAR